MDKAGVEPKATSKEALSTEFFRNVKGRLRAACIDEIEGIIPHVERLRSSTALPIVGGASIGGGDEVERGAETVPNLIRNLQSGRNMIPQVGGREGIGHAIANSAVGLNHFSWSDVAKVEFGDEFCVFRGGLRWSRLAWL